MTLAGRIALALTALLAAACGGAPRGPDTVARATERRVTTDLVTLLPHTESVQETKAIDFGTPVGDAHLLAGWSHEAPRGTAPQRSAAYLRQPSSRLFFHLRRVAPRTLVLRCQAVHALRQMVRVTLRLNGAYIGTGVFTPQMSELTVQVAEGVQRAGRNELAMRASLPPRLPPGMARRLAGREPSLACDWLRLRGGGSGKALARLAQDPDGHVRLVIGPGATASYYVQTGHETRLRIAATRDAAGSEVNIEQVTAEGETRVLLHGPLGEAERELALTGRPGEVALVRVAAFGRQAADIERLAIEDLRRERTDVASASAPRARPNLLLYVVDTLRADRLGCYGADRALSPHIDALAAEGVLFEDAQAQASWTRPAVGSILTGCEPRRHGAVTLTAQLTAAGQTLAGLLHDQGYATAALVTNMNVSPRWGFDRGFERYRYLTENMDTRRVYTPARVLHRAALRWLDEAGTRPFFLYLHASDVHAPYTPGARETRQFERLDLRPVPAPLARPLLVFGRNPRAATPAQVDWLRSLYDAELAGLDGEFGRLVEALRARRLLDRTLVVFVSDHGEEFFEHGGFSHGNTLYQEQLRVPLIVRFPDRRHAGRRVRELVRQVDIMPTILSSLGLPSPEDIDGESALPLLEAGDDAAPRLAVSHTALGAKDISSVTTADWQVIFGSGGGVRRPAPRPVEAYDRRRDPAEQAELGAEGGQLVGFARQVVGAGARFGRPAEIVEQPLGEEALRKLRALGYVGP